jgi:biotin carboxyl carrier protein
MIEAYIPGTIHSVYVEKGQQVKEGDPLVILEAMKMRNVVTVPADGFIRKVNVRPGDVIPKGFLIAELE